MSCLIDIDTLNGAVEAIQMIRMFRLIAERGATFDDFRPTTSDDDLMEYRIQFLETYCTEVFPEFDEHHVNNSEFEYAHLFQDTIDYFDSDEQYVVGFLFTEPYLYEFYEMCKKKGIKCEDTMFGTYIWSANSAIPSYGDGYTYMEVFMPYDDIVEETKSPVILFFTDSTLCTYDMIKNLFDAFDYCKDVVEGKIPLEENK